MIRLRMKTVCNATVIKSIDGLAPWHAHLRSTLLSKQYDLCQQLYEQMASNFDSYDIEWCSAKANRYCCIQCKICKQGVFGKYDYYVNEEDMEVAIKAIADFLNVVLDPGAEQM